MNSSDKTDLIGAIFTILIIAGFIGWGIRSCDMETKDNIKVVSLPFEQVFMNRDADWSFISGGVVYRYSWIKFEEFGAARIIYDASPTEKQWAKIVQYKRCGEYYTRVAEVHLHPGEKVGAGSYSEGKFGTVQWHEVK